MTDTASGVGLGGGDFFAAEGERVLDDLSLPMLLLPLGEVDVLAVDVVEHRIELGVASPVRRPVVETAALLCALLAAPRTSRLSFGRTEAGAWRCSARCTGPGGEWTIAIDLPGLSGRRLHQR
ncbi:hypothetical protein [Herbiconiux sp. L3-i23]|uniref:hypothetical protein n=1 Tax=Herbiconiux sp. L3-i23 TaxID=2905871 RepID=UPI002055D02F|nr:hypothetical protein [Herbiconiux sp. L3-i23]BDI22583.1 hypothetical protein L3i23_13590 [Herbiconiux sp. L3-i23]